ncbi:cobalt ABC transporter permease 2, CbiQ [Thermococcus cleftensis]|uniref:Cobalt ABC transporter permease 2, CbiQ n=1 Tax=Thermococcus cleftensis (strain DSM 27260 / KACC 17922 / CL1) TaxID=163003 RepID=I3ZW08_THECF|nr:MULTISPECIES: energy-coupling factor transporter transmembrane component T [Thermococcus]AFL95892.1 cobalt ABC transporter permease 2, CbiQ [Thermococcus cleftensis]NJE02705.1 energy-coupling factor transporter transmembrane protein EcfT [Thermococcus sp. MV11]
MIYPFYTENDSLLHSLDPRVKIIGTAAGIAALMLYNDPAVLIPMFFLFLLVGRLLGGVGLGEQLRLLKPLLPIVVITLVVWPLIYEPRLKGLLFGVSFAMRLLTFALLTFLLLMTTSQRDLILGFVRLGMPYEFGLTISIALRYIPTLYLLSRNIMDAQRSRGWEVDRGNFIVRAKKMTAVLIPLLVASLKTAHELSIALESRALGASKKRTFLYDIEMSARDYAAVVLVLVLFGLAVYLRYALGIGHVSIYN